MSTKISALPPSAGLVLTDIFPVVDDPGGTPVTQKATLTQLETLFSSSFAPSGSGVLSFNTRTGAVTLLSADVTGALTFTPEDVANKSIDGTLAANSDILYPSQKAVKTYVDAASGSGVVSFNTRTGAVTLLSADVTGALTFTPENVANKSIDGTLAANSDILYPSQQAVKTYADAGVRSFNTRTGAVTLLLADVTALVDTRYVLKAGDTMTGALVHPDGTAALPSITFTGDLDTGIYRIGANNFGLSAGGVLTLGVSTTGVNLTTALAYQYNSVNVIRAQTAIDNYFFGPSGNLTMTGAGNTSVGARALVSNTTGPQNTAVGIDALNANLSGTSNTAVGRATLLVNTTGGSNTALGWGALGANIGGSRNTAVGWAALSGSTSGNDNISIGYLSGFSLTTGSDNTIIGANSGLLGISTGSNNTVIGANVSGLAAGLANNIILADGAGNQRINVDSSGNTTLAGTVATAAGTAALPAFTFSTDLNTGLYSIGGDSVGLSTGGTLRITTNTTDFILATAFRLAMASGANQRAGNAVLVAGTVTVANTSVTANTVILATRKTSGGTIGFSLTYTVSAATSFTLTSDNALDTSTYSYMLIEVP